MNAEATATTRFNIALNIATTLKAEGVEVVSADLSNLGLRVDVRGKAGAATAKKMLTAAGLLNVRSLNEGKGLWIVVGKVA